MATASPVARTGISLLEIIEAIEGDTRRRTCILRGGPCLANGQCSVHEVFSSAQEALRDSLATAMLARVVTFLPSAPPAIPTLRAVGSS